MTCPVVASPSQRESSSFPWTGSRLDSVRQRQSGCHLKECSRPRVIWRWAPSREVLRGFCCDLAWVTCFDLCVAICFVLYVATSTCVCTAGYEDSYLVCLDSYLVCLDSCPD